MRSYKPSTDLNLFSHWVYVSLFNHTYCIQLINIAIPHCARAYLLTACIVLDPVIPDWQRAALRTSLIPSMFICACVQFSKLLLCASLIKKLLNADSLVLQVQSAWPSHPFLHCRPRWSAHSALYRKTICKCK